MTKRKSILKPKEVESELRDYQLNGVDQMIEYIRRFDKNKTSKSALVAMPTGSGKTAIIASLACCFPRKGCILVLSHRRPVVNQLHKELSGNLFTNKFKNLKKIPTKKVFESTVSKNQLKEDCVVCWTIQRLLVTKKSNNTLYKALKKVVSLIMFDEGHYEPAIQWSEAVRSFETPRIIFTATPFRNDFKKFDIDWVNNVYRVKFSDLLDKQYLRNVNIEDIGSKSTLVESIQDALGRFRKIKKKYNDARLIIKCDSSESILAISNYLKTKSQSFLSIHETFTKNFVKKNPHLKDHLIKTVPINQESLNVDIWVHQFKLIEGIDSSKFIALAIVEEITNTRLLVQQIGRIIRNPKRVNEFAEVFNYTDSNYKNIWEGYLELDSKDAITQTLSERVFNSLQDNLEEFSYVDKKIRSKLTSSLFESWTIDDLKEQLKIPLKANFIKKINGFKHQNFADLFLDKHFKDKSHIFFKNIYGKKSGLYLYFNIQNSPYLSETFFPQITHHICFFKEEDKYLIFYDSGGISPLGKDELKLGFGIDSSSLKSILKQSKETVINRVSLKSSDIGSKEPNSYSFIASSVEKTTPNLNDFSHFMSSAFGYYKDKKVFKDYKDERLKDKEFQIPTYIGFASGRVSQSEGGYVRFKEYLDWIDYINNLIKKGNNSSLVFSRYATEVVNETDPIPQCILLDLFDFENTMNLVVSSFDETEETDEEKFIISETFFMVNKDKNQYSFELPINDEKYPVKIVYGTKNAKFKLESEEISGVITLESSVVNQRVVSLIKNLNKRQSFRILTEKGLSYSGGRFYTPHFKFGNAFKEENSPIVKMMFSVGELDKRFAEKGTLNGSNTDSWQDDSIFSLIDSRGKNTELESHFFEDGNEKEELLICTDLQTEPADFIFVSNKKIAFIHVKGKGNKSTVARNVYGASSISEVCNQGIKNAHHLSIFDNSVPKNINDWSKPWKLSDEYIVKKRIRTTTLPSSMKKTKPETIWNYIANKKLDVNISKEVWLVMGYTFNKSKFINAIGKPKPAAEAKQSTLTLESTMATIHSLGIKLKVFCS